MSDTESVRLPHPESGVNYFSEFFQAAKTLLESEEIGREHRRKALSAVLRGGGNSGPDVGLGFSGGQSLLPGNIRLMAAARSWRICFSYPVRWASSEGKAGPVFDYPQPFPGTIGCRVEDPKQGYLVGKRRRIHSPPS